MNSVPEDILKLVTDFCDHRSTVSLAITSKVNYNKLWDRVGTYTCELYECDDDILVDEIADDFVVSVKQPKAPSKCITCDFHTANLCEECKKEMKHAQFLMGLEQDAYDDAIKTYNNDTYNLNMDFD